MSSRNEFTITPEELSVEQAFHLALSDATVFRLSDESRGLIERCRRYLDDRMGFSGTPIYGITTGFGSLYNRTISDDQLSRLQENLVKSHACSVGEPLRRSLVRLMLLLKAHALSLGHSGVQVATVERILDFLNYDINPLVYDRGSLGASGDLAPLANLFLPLLGMGEVEYGGAIRDAGEVLQELGLEPIELQSKEGLALLNGTQFMSAHGVDAVMRSLWLIAWANVIGAISLEAYDGRIEPFHPNIQQVRDHRGQAMVASTVRDWLAGSELIVREKAHVQDPYSFRCIPQVHGACFDVIGHAWSVVLTEINSVTDNPTIWPDEDLIISGGNFHGEPLALVYDYLALAISELANISERRVAQLILGQRGLPEFLVANPGVNSGFMIPQYAAAAMVSQNKQLCCPASVDSIVSSNGQEDLVSMGANAATKLQRILENTERVLGIELLNAVQALEFRRPGRSSASIEALVKAYRERIPFVEEDVIMHTLMNESVVFMNEYDLKLVES